MPWTGPGPNNGTYINYHQIWDNDVESFSLFGSVDWQVSMRTLGDFRRPALDTEEDRSAIGGNVFENSQLFRVQPSRLRVQPQATSPNNVSPEVTAGLSI